VNAPAVRQPAAELALRHLGDGARVLVLGAGGWFGSTGLELIAASGRDVAVLALTATPRTAVGYGQSWPLVAWDWDQIERFAPTLVLNCAFRTREQVDQVGHEQYVADNAQLTARFLRTLTLPTVSAALTFSSGAAAVPSDGGIADLETNPYGYLKWCEEVLAANLAASAGVALVIARTWSVSGPLVRRPHDYGFSDIILQAASGHIALRAANQVWRRYVGADELLAVCLAKALSGCSATVESGGPLVELGELAALVTALVAPHATVERPAADGEADHYHSDGHSWSEICGELRYDPAPIEEQIVFTAAGLLG
jgi:nucleoside-diphosphate-sugar epimerase